VLLQYGTGKSRFLVKIIYVGIRDHFIQIPKSRQILGQQNDMVCPVFFDIDGSIRKHGILIGIQISFHAVNDFDILSFAPKFCRSISRIREGLHHAVIRNRHRLLTPGRRLIHQFRDFVEAVVVAHLRVHVKLHPLFPRVLIFALRF